MAASIGSLNLKLSADATALVAGLAKAAQATKAFAGGAAASIGALAGLGQIGLAVGGLKTLFDSLAGVVGWPLQLAANAEQSRIRLGAFFGDAKLGEEVFARLEAMASSSTFDLPDLQQAAKILSATGLSAQDLEGTLRTLGDVAAGSGTSLAQIAETYARIQSTGTLTFRQLNSLTQEGIPIVHALGEALGKTEDEVRAMAHHGQLGFGEFAAALESLTAKGAGAAGVAEALREAGRAGGVTSGVLEKLAGEGVSALGELALELRVSEAEVYKLADAGRIGLGQFQAAAERASKGGAFAGMAGRMAHTLGGLWTVLTHQAEAAAQRIGEALVEGFDLKEVTGRVAAFADWVVGEVKGTLLPLFRRASELAQAVWAGFQAAWESFGLPTAQQFSDWLKGFGGGEDFGKSLIDSFAFVAAQGMETFAALKQAVGAFLRDAIGPLLDSMADLSAQLIELGKNGEILKGIFNPLHGIPTSAFSPEMTEAAKANRDAIKATAESLKKLGDSLAKGTVEDATKGLDAFVTKWRTKYEAPLATSAVAGGLGFALQQPAGPAAAVAGGLNAKGGPPPGKAGKDKVEHEVQVKIAGAMERDSREAYSAIVKWQTAQSSAYGPAEQKRIQERIAAAAERGAAATEKLLDEQDVTADLD